MTIDWVPLRSALARYRAAGIDLPFWWRDDDAVTATPALDRLAALSTRTEMPVHLAIIPAHAEDTLATALPDTLIPVIHGWAHHDHSDDLDKKNEFLTPRPDAASDTARAMEKMRHLFGARLRPMFVPPWNRISTDVAQHLHGQGYTALSTYRPRTAPEAAPGLAQINTHLDPIWWKGTRDLVDPDHLIAQASQHLDARRVGAEDHTEPFGLLTHHLVHTDAIWNFTASFVQELRTGGATPWTMET